MQLAGRVNAAFTPLPAQVSRCCDLPQCDCRERNAPLTNGEAKMVFAPQFFTFAYEAASARFSPGSPTSTGTL
jgi:hypothetical protein